MKPGDILEGLVPYVVCATINDLDQYVTIPKFIVDGLVAASGLTPRWPAGIFVIFIDDGASVCVYGTTENQAFEIRHNIIALSEDQSQPVGDDVWQMWKKLRSVPEVTLTRNLEKLLLNS